MRGSAVKIILPLFSLEFIAIPGQQHQQHFSASSCHPHHSSNIPGPSNPLFPLLQVGKLSRQPSCSQSSGGPLLQSHARTFQPASIGERLQQKFSHWTLSALPTIVNHRKGQYAKNVERSQRKTFASLSSVAIITRHWMKKNGVIGQPISLSSCPLGEPLLFLRCLVLCLYPFSKHSVARCEYKTTSQHTEPRVTKEGVPILPTGKVQQEGIEARTTTPYRIPSATSIALDEEQLPTFSSLTVFSEAKDRSPEKVREPFLFFLFQGALKWILVTAKLTQLMCLATPLSLILATWSTAFALRTMVETLLAYASRVIRIPASETLSQILSDGLTTLEKVFVDFSWHYFYWAVSVAGPSYIKFVQWAATRSDVFAPSLCTRFAKYHCDVMPHPYPYTVKVLDEALGQDWSSRVWMDPKCIGAGCVAQVYRGIRIVRPNEGNDTDAENDKRTATQSRFQEVAMKIVHPYTERAMEIDFNLMQLIANIINCIPRIEYLAFPETIRQFRSTMMLQLDMNIEATNLETFHHNLSRTWSRKHLKRLGARVLVPTILRDLTSKGLLIESYEEGMTLGQWMRLTKKLEESSTPSNSSTAGQRAASTTAAVDDEAARWNTKGFFLTYIEDSLRKDKSLSLDPLSPRLSLWRDYQHRLPYLLGTGRQLLCDQVNNMKGAVADVLIGVSKRFDIPYGDLLPDPTASPDYGMKAYWPVVARSGLAFFLQMLFVDNLIHADLHPGNLIIRFRKIERKDPRGRWEKRWSWFRQGIRVITRKDVPEKTSNTDSKLLTEEQLKQRLRKRYGSTLLQSQTADAAAPTEKRESFDSISLLRHSAFVGQFDDVDFEVVVLDAGLTTSLSFSEYCNFVDLLRCICTGDGYTGGKLMIERSPKVSCQDVDGFCKEVETLVRVYHSSREGRSTLGDTRVGEIASRMLTAACVHGVELDPKLISVIAGIVVLEGVGRQLDPNTDLIRSAFPYIKRVMLDATVVARSRSSQSITDL